jgi:hypothetical protein
MQIASIELYDLLKVKVGEKEAKALVTFIDGEVKEAVEKEREHFITIADKEKLLTKADALTIFATKEDVANVKAEIIKWMFLFTIGQIAATVGIIIGALRWFIK